MTMFAAVGTLSSAMATAAPDAATCDRIVHSETTAQTNKIEIELLRASAQRDSSDLALRIEPIEVDRWTPEKDARFHELARNEALGELSLKELAELELLTRLRRTEKYPRSADEILWQRRQRSLTRTLVQALQEYVEFHEAPRST